MGVGCLDWTLLVGVGVGGMPWACLLLQWKLPKYRYIVAAVEDFATSYRIEAIKRMSRSCKVLLDLVRVTAQCSSTMLQELLRGAVPNFSSPFVN